MPANAANSLPRPVCPEGSPTEAVGEDFTPEVAEDTARPDREIGGEA